MLKKSREKHFIERKNMAHKSFCSFWTQQLCSQPGPVKSLWLFIKLTSLKQASHIVPSCLHPMFNDSRKKSVVQILAMKPKVKQEICWQARIKTTRT